MSGQGQSQGLEDVIDEAVGARMEAVCDTTGRRGGRCEYFLGILGMP